MECPCGQKSYKSLQIFQKNNLFDLFRFVKFLAQRL